MNRTENKDVQTDKGKGPSRGSERSLGFSIDRKVLVFRIHSTTTGNEKTIKLDKDRLVIGSVVSAEVRLTGEGVAPIHAVIERSVQSEKTPAQVTIFDLASDTGLFVDGKRVVTHVLTSDHKVKIGSYEIRCALEEIETTDRIKRSDGRALFLNPAEDLTPLLLEDEREIIEIFDFRPTAKRALEVVMSWYGMILTVEHFTHEKSVTIGSTKKSDFAIPPLLSSGHYPIVTQSSGKFTLNLDTKMKGVIQRTGTIKSLEEVLREAMRGPNGYEIPIGENDFAKIGIGEVDFYLSFTAAPPKLKRRRIFDRDPVFLKIFFISMVLSISAVLGLSRMKVPEADPDKVPERIATILYQPEKFLKPPPVPTPKPTPKETPKPKEAPVVKITPTAKPVDKPPPKEMKVVKEEKPPAQPPKRPPSAKSEAKEGEGAKAKGASGTRGEKDAPNRSQQHVTKAERPSAQPGKGGAAGKSNAPPDEGNVDFLKGVGGKIGNILGNSAAGLGEGGKALKGFGNFSSRGSGGLALSGTGQGGGGTADTTLGGLGNKGSGMGRVGTGKGAIGTGTGIVGSQARVSIRADGPEEAVVMGAIDRDAVAAAIYAHKDEFRLCYEKEINAEHPNLAGQVGTSFIIGASGRVNQAGIESSSLHSPNAERCIVEVLKRIDFPIPKGGGQVEVHFPFKFSSGGH